MNNINRIRNAGITCIIGAIIWILAITIEYAFDLLPPGSGTAFMLNQVMFIVAMVGQLAGILGLMWAQAGGNRWFAKVALGLFALGWIALIVATVISLFTQNNDQFLFPLGGLAASLGCLLAGIAVVMAKRWQGWQRWAVLIYAVYYWAALFLPLAIANQEPTQVTETIWGVVWLLIGFALFTKSRESEPMLV